MSKRLVFLFLCGVFLSGFARGQVIAPVQVTPQLLPPYGVYLADYASSERLRVILVQQDLTQPSYSLRLLMSLKLNGREVVRLRPDFIPPPLIVEPQIPQLLSGADIAPYLQSENWLFTGLDRAQYERTKALPEGAYELCFVAVDYARPEVQVSNVGCAFYFLSKNEPPLLNTPACGTQIPSQTLPQIVFSWLPRNTSSPTSAQETEYKLQLFEVRPKGRNINDVVLSSPPVFEAVVDVPQYVYGVADPPLLDSMEYAWRVQARDISGRDAFRNQGYSPVCIFTYGGVPQGFTVGVPVGFRGTARNKQHIQYDWAVEEDSFDLYRLEYKKVGEGYAWFSSQTKQLTYSVWDVEPNTTYEARLQGRKQGVWGGYTPLVTLRTPPDVPAVCGDSLAYPEADLSKPLLALAAGTQLDARGMDMQITEATSLPAAGHFKGKGVVIAPWLGGRFKVTFEDLYIDEHLILGEGTIYFVSQGIDNFKAGQLSEQEARKRRRQQQANALHFADLDFFGEVFLYQDRTISHVRVTEQGKIEITDDKGNTVVNDSIAALRANNPDKAFVVQDKNGDQWVIKPDGSVEKAIGGGLPPVRIDLSSEEEMLIRRAYKVLLQEYNLAKIATLETELRDARQAYQTAFNNRANGAGVSSNAVLDTVGVIQTHSGNGTISNSKAQPLQQDTFTEHTRYKQANDMYIFSLVLQVLPHTGKASKVFFQRIAASLEVEKQPFLTYAREAKSKQTPKETQITAIKSALQALIYTLVETLPTKR